MAAPPKTLPAALASGPALHGLVRVELTNGTLVVGRLLEMDPITMNLKIDAITYKAVRRRHVPAHPSPGQQGPSSSLSASASPTTMLIEEEVDPIALRCTNSMVVRGACVRFLDFIQEGKDGGSSFGEVVAAAAQVRPSV